MRPDRLLNRTNLACRKIRVQAEPDEVSVANVSTRACSRYQSRVGFETRSTANLCPNNPA